MAASHNIPSEHDLELLSAYIDNELPDHERVALEQRLAHEDVLRIALDNLRHTAALVRGLPRLKAPRNFTLDPAVYSRKPSWWQRLLTFENALQLSGALGAAASILLIALAVLWGGQADSDKDQTAASKIALEQAALPTATAQPESMQNWAATSTSLPTGTPLPSATIALSDAAMAGAVTAEKLHSETPAPTTTLPLTASPTVAIEYEADVSAVEEAPAGQGVVMVPGQPLTATPPPLPSPAMMTDTLGPDAGAVEEAEAAFNEAAPAPDALEVEDEEYAEEAAAESEFMGDAEAAAPEAVGIYAEATRPPATVTTGALSQPTIALTAVVQAGAIPEPTGARDTDETADEQAGEAGPEPMAEAGEAVPEEGAEMPAEAPPPTAVTALEPVPATQPQAARPPGEQTGSGLVSEARESAQEEEQDRNRWWLTGIGLVLLGVSSALYFAGRRKARRL
ncbi:MAG: hypothetical protein JXJ20_04755 [Anaerolineae bacterium]|nr:hypothetical protein [Anaerolineae bacterium]